MSVRAEEMDEKTMKEREIEITIALIAQGVAEAVRGKVLAQLGRLRDAGQQPKAYANELATSAVLNQYMNNPADKLAHGVAEMAMEWPELAGLNEASGGVNYCGVKRESDPTVPLCDRMRKRGAK